jgi:hypothetical protein
MYRDEEKGDSFQGLDQRDIGIGIDSRTHSK